MKLYFDVLTIGLKNVPIPTQHFESSSIQVKLWKCEVRTLSAKFLNYQINIIGLHPHPTKSTCPFFFFLSKAFKAHTWGIQFLLCFFFPPQDVNSSLFTQKSSLCNYSHHQCGSLSLEG